MYMYMCNSLHMTRDTCTCLTKGGVWCYISVIIIKVYSILVGGVSILFGGSLFFWEG